MALGVRLSFVIGGNVNFNLTDCCWFLEKTLLNLQQKVSCSPLICRIAPVKDSRCWYERTTEAGGSKGGSSGSHHMLGKWYLMMGWAAQTRVIVARATSHTLTISETRDLDQILSGVWWEHFHVDKKVSVLFKSLFIRLTLWSASAPHPPRNVI